MPTYPQGSPLSPGLPSALQTPEPEGERLILEGGRFDIDDRASQVHPGDDLLRLRLGDATVTLADESALANFAATLARVMSGREGTAGRVRGCAHASGARGFETGTCRIDCPSMGRAEEGADQLVQEQLRRPGGH